MKVEAFYKKRKQLSEYLPASERHKLKVERIRGQTAAAAAAASLASAVQNSPARTVIDKSNDNSLMDSPAQNATVVTSGKRRPSDPDSEADMSLSGDSSRMPSIEVTNGEEAAQPPMKKSNTTTTTSNGNSLEVS